MRTLGLIIATALFAAACATAAPAPSGPLPGYTPAWRESFLRGCLTGGTVPQEICECGITNIEREVPFEASQALDRAAAANRPIDPHTLEQYTNIMQRCMAEHPT